MRANYLFLIALLVGGTLYAQNSIKPADLVQYHKGRNQLFSAVNDILAPQNTSIRNRPEIMNEVSEALLLSFSAQNARQIGQQVPLTMTLDIPTADNGVLEIELVQVNIFSPEFWVHTSEGQTIAPELGTHYRGVIKGRTNSLAAFSFFDDQVVGFASIPRVGNYVVGPLNGDNPAREHIVYNDRDLLLQASWECHTEDDGGGYTQEQLLPTHGRALSECVRIYYEVDYDVYSDKGSGTAGFVAAEFNEIATLYANESINYLLNEVYINTTSSSAYSNGNSSSLLNQFKSRTSSINGATLGHLITYRTSGGVAAGFEGICNSNVDNSLCISDIYGNFSTVPTYSWDIMVQTHEMGHLNGSRHTHACVWNGNNTAIDGCAGGTEGSCSVPGYPSGGGTIMSYCHIQSVGINLANGFGPQPGNVIRGWVQNANCLSACDGGGGDRCTNSISSYPYTENYEGGITWSQNTNDDFNWISRSGSTPSSNTGPSSAAQGSQYAYMEVSSPNYPSRNAIMTSPCFDLTSLNNPEISFQYHAYGATVGNLRLEVSTDGNNWNAIWSISGDQGNVWRSAAISLSGYSNETELQFRFNGTSGSSYTGDICVDDLRVGNASGGGGGQQYASLPYSTGFESGSFDTYWSTQSSASVGRVQVTNVNGPSGNYHVTLDVTTNNNFSQNEARLHLNLAGESNVSLSFDWKEFSDENHTQDGVFFSDNGGSSFTKVADLINGTSTYQTINLDVSALAAANGLSLSSTFVIKFQQYDNYTMTTDGHAIDNINVSAGAAGCPSINFNSYTINSYGGTQDQGTHAVQSGGITLFLQNNAWKSITYNYNVTTSTVIEFDFLSTSQGEIHGIGFDNDNSISSNLTFKVHGTQAWGIGNYDNYSGASWRSYTIPVGSFYTGSFNRLTFTCDNDAAPTTGNAYFRNVKVYEGSCSTPASLGTQPQANGPIEAILGDQEEFNFEVFPMPVIDRMITALDAENGLYEIELIDLNGKAIWHSEITNSQQAHDISHLPAGMYLLKVDLGDGRTITRKVSKIQ
ncbi:MAG: M12 family metallo-peptidase [Bacteroidota bacterium]